jgi:hypothetical protein
MILIKKIMMVIVILFMLMFGLMFFMAHTVNAANKEANTICSNAIIGENIESFKERVGMKESGVLSEKGNKYVFIFPTMAFSAATCNFGIEKGKIISKMVEKVEAR